MLYTGDENSQEMLTYIPCGCAQTMSHDFVASTLDFSVNAASSARLMFVCITCTVMQTNININININCHKPQPPPQQWGTRVTREEGRLATCEEGGMWGKGLETHMCLEPQVHFFCTSFFYAKNLKNIGYLHEPTTTRQEWPTLATNASQWAILNSLTHPRTPSSLQSQAGGVLFYTTTHPQARFKRELVGHFHMSSYYLAHSNCR
jgi:hypothetical protein